LKRIVTLVSLVVALPTAAFGRELINTPFHVLEAKPLGCARVTFWNIFDDGCPSEPELLAEDSVLVVYQWPTPALVHRRFAWLMYSRRAKTGDCPRQLPTIKRGDIITGILNYDPSDDSAEPYLSDHN
jgi:hypothetical protein